MLIGNKRRKSNIGKVRRIKSALKKSLTLPEDAIITITELACLEEDCAPLETVFGLLRPNMEQMQHRIHKEIEDITSEDLLRVCLAWDFETDSIDFEKI